MNENAKKWVEALVSGRYKQGTGHLREQDEFCCLGVACDLYSKSVKDAPQWEVDDDGVGRYDGERDALPGPVREWLGLGTALGGDIRGEGVESLAAYNDSGTPFRSIAGIIEDEPDGLFLRTLEQPSCGVIITPQDLLPEGYPHYPDWGIDWEDVERWEQDHEKDEGYED